MAEEAAPDSDIANASNSWRYQRERHGVPAAFVRHPDFERFREHMTALTDELSTHVTDSPQAVAGLRQFLSNVTTVDAGGKNLFFQEQAGQIYHQGAELLDRLVLLSRDPQVERLRLHAELVDLSKDLDLCSAAVIQGLQSCVQRLSAPPRTLQDRWHDMRVQLVEQSAAETVRLSRHGTTNRHVVNALLPDLYRKAKLPVRPPDDPYVATDLEQSLVDEAGRRLADDLHPASVSIQIAQDYLARLSASLRETNDKASATPRLTLTQMEAAIELLAADFGCKPPPSAVLRVDSDDGLCEVTTDATLLAAYFLDCWRSESRAGRTDARSQPVAFGNPPAGTKFMRAGRLAWAETHGERRLLDFDDLERLKPEKVPADVAASIIRGCAPDALWTALPAKWMRDTAAFDALLDRVDDVALRACFERWQSSPAPLSKDQQVMLRDALLARGRGAAFFEGATLHWQRLTLPDLEDLDGLRALYRRRQSGEITARALRGRLQTIWMAALSGDLWNLVRVSMPGLPPEARMQASAQFVQQWLFAAAEALSSNPPRTTIDDVCSAMRSGTLALGPSAPGEDWEIGAKQPAAAMLVLGEAEAKLDSPRREQVFRPGEARHLLHGFLDLHEGRSRLLQWAWRSGRVHPQHFFVYLETAVRAMVQRGCKWSELSALLQVEGVPHTPEMIERLAYARAFILVRSYPDGPAALDQLPLGFSSIPTARKAFADTGIQPDDIDAQA